MIFRFRIQTMHEISKLTFHQAFVYTRLPLLYPVPWFMPFAKLHSKDFKTQANTKKTPHVLKQNRQTARLVPKDRRPKRAHQQQNSRQLGRKQSAEDVQIHQTFTFREYQPIDLAMSFNPHLFPSFNISRLLTEAGARHASALC